MAQFDDCIRSAQQQGVLSEDEADALIARYAEHRESAAASGQADVDAGAKAALAKEMDEIAAVKKAVADGGAAARERIVQFVQDYRTLDGKPNAFEAFANLLESFGGNTSSIKNRADAIARMSHGEMADFLTTFRRSRLTGGRFNQPQLENVVREIKGEGTGSPEAKGMAEAVSGQIESLRQRFNKAAGYEAIGKLEIYLPQYHDPYALLRSGFDAWRDYIKPKLDMDKMRDPATGGVLSPERLDESLKITWQRIVTNGWSDREPSAQPFGTGAMATRRSEHRFLHFKTADDWLAYNRDYGGGDPTKAIFNHIRSMSHDIASMDILGPNPNSTLTWMKQVLQSEAAKAAIGEPTLHGGSVGPDAGDKAANRLQAIFDAVQGKQIVSGRVATAARCRSVVSAGAARKHSCLESMGGRLLDRRGSLFACDHFQRSRRTASSGKVVLAANFRNRSRQGCDR